MGWAQAAAGAADRVDGALDAVFGAAANPLRHLGALGFLLFWVIVASGVWLYAVFDPEVSGARASVEALSATPLGNLARGLHRYASDAFVVVVVLHLVREWLLGRFTGARWFPWVSGVALLWLVYLSGIGGYWLIADRVAQYSLAVTAEWLDWLPIAASAMVRNFVLSGQLSDRFFSLLVFLHIGVPLTLLLGMWVHIQRVVAADVNPRRPLALGVLAMLTLLSLAAPAPLTAAMDFAAIPADLPLDWFLLFVHPLTEALSPGPMWLLAIGGTALLLAQPWLARTRRIGPAVVSPRNCNGCGRCFADCPFGAVVVEPRRDGRRAAGLARVNESLCTSCGICAGACPSSTPFRSAAELVAGIDLPDRPLAVLRDALDAGIAATVDRPPLVVFGCRHAIDTTAIEGPTLAIGLLCAAQLPPAFVEYALRGGALAVAVIACAEDGCRFRTGTDLLASRFEGVREPHLRPTVPRQRVRVIHASRHETARVAAELARWRARLESQRPSPDLPAHKEPKRLEHRPHPITETSHV